VSQPSLNVFGSARARGFRLGLYPLAIATCAIVPDGFTVHVVGMVATLFALAAYVFETPRFLRLIFMWCAGFLLIITPEGLQSADKIARIYGQEAFDIASRCLVASHLAVLFGHDLIFNEAKVRPSTSPWRLSTRLAVPLLVILWCAATVYLLPTALVAFRGGRVATGLSSTALFDVIAGAIVASLRIVIPIAAVWIARRRRGLDRYLMLAVAAGSIALEMIYAVRFVLLFVSVGCFVAWTAPGPLTRRAFVILAVIAVSLALASAVSKSSRTYGLGTADVGEVVENTSTDYFIMSEESVKSMTQAVVHAKRRGFTDGRTTFTLAFFWVPRAFWPEKPTLIGYWLPREFGRVDAGHSAAPGFTGSTYVDVGLWPSVVVWFFAGLLFGLFERVAARVLASPEDTRLFLVAPLYGASFFAVRSPDTTAVMLSGALIAAFLLLLTAGRYVARPAAVLHR
jgi:hypothetical protein